MLTVDPQSGTPIYLQIIEQVRHSIAMGVYAPGDALPTIRELALQLRVNPNTVAKAIRELEREGLLVTRVGKGSFVSDAAAGSVDRDREARGDELSERFVNDMRWLGFDLDDTLNTVRTKWKEEKNHD